jgi:ABC-2 type transport system ATP-binding protein
VNRGLPVRIQDLRKVYTSAPPVAAGGRGPLSGGGAPGRRAARRIEITALDGISLEIAPGELFGLLGPNGAGKSTTIGILTTRVLPTSGTAWIGHVEVSRNPVAVKRRIGVVPQRPNLDLALTAREILLFHGAYFGIPAPEREERARTLLDRFQLTERADDLVRGFSGGMMQRLSIARALAHEPEVLFLDEPSVGLDPQTRILLWRLIRDYHGEGHTIVLTTHNMEEADSLCERLAIIDHGRVIGRGTPEELKKSVPGGYLISLQFGGEVTEHLVASVRDLPGVTEVRGHPEGRLEVYADRGGPLVPKLVGIPGDGSPPVVDVHVSEPSLENLFLHLTGRSLRE